MRARGIIFSGPMVLAIREERKTQTRRVINPQPDRRETEFWFDAERGEWFGVCPRNQDNDGHPTGGRYFRCPYGLPGDRMWVKETWLRSDVYCQPATDCIGYKADGELRSIGHDGTLGKPLAWRIDDEPKWKSPLFMPRWASRISLEVTNVRVEQVQDITDADCRAEGIEDLASIEVPGGPLCTGYYYKHSFESLWDSLAKPGFRWADNPWVWVRDFKIAKDGKDEANAAQI